MRSVAECVSKGSSGPNAYDERKLTRNVAQGSTMPGSPISPATSMQRAQRLADVLHVMALA